MHVRIQGPIPYEVQIYINGWEWLARQLDKAGVGYGRDENSLLAMDDLERAARLCDRFAHRSWPRVLNAFARRLNPLLASIAGAGFGGYYWVLDQAEIATDVMFRSRSELLAVWPDLVRHAALNMSAEDVLGFLGRKLHPSLVAAQVVTDTKRRPQGWRVRHRVAGNWVKVYDKVSKSCGSRRPSTTRASSESFASSPTRPAGASGVGAPCEKGSATCGATTRWGSARTAATSTPWRLPPSRAKVSPPSTPCAGPEPPEGGSMPVSTR